MPSTLQGSSVTMSGAIAEPLRGELRLDVLDANARRPPDRRVHLDEQRERAASLADDGAGAAQDVEFGPFDVDLDEVGPHALARAEVVEARHRDRGRLAASAAHASRLSPAVPATSSRPVVVAAPAAAQTGVTIASR